MTHLNFLKKYLVTHEVMQTFHAMSARATMKSLVCKNLFLTETKIFINLGPAIFLPFLILFNERTCVLRSYGKVRAKNSRELAK